jgi:hypothetical protein
MKWLIYTFLSIRLVYLVDLDDIKSLLLSGTEFNLLLCGVNGRDASLLVYTGDMKCLIYTSLSITFVYLVDGVLGVVGLVISLKFKDVSLSNFDSVDIISKIYQSYW